MATSGVDRYIKIWDLRNTYREVVRYRVESGATDLDFSQRHLLAAAIGNLVHVRLSLRHAFINLFALLLSAVSGDL